MGTCFVGTVNELPRNPISVEDGPIRDFLDNNRTTQGKTVGTYDRSDQSHSGCHTSGITPI